MQSNQKHIINELKVSIKMHKVNYTKWSSITIMFILSTCSINVLSGNPFVKGSTIIRLVLICYIDTLCFWTSSFTIKYFNSIRLVPLEYLSFLEKKYWCGVITIHFQVPSNTINNPSKTITAASNVCIYTSNKMQNKISYETPNINIPNNKFNSAR